MSRIISINNPMWAFANRFIISFPLLNWKSNQTNVKIGEACFKLNGHRAHGIGHTSVISKQSNAYIFAFLFSIRIERIFAKANFNIYLFAYFGKMYFHNNEAIVSFWWALNWRATVFRLVGMLAFGPFESLSMDNLQRQN